MPGVIRTRAGYAGGTTISPTYRRIGDHAEALQVEFDPTVISFETIMRAFWRGHNPTRPMWSRQYMSAAYYHNDEQRKIIETTRDEYEAEAGKAVSTEITAAGVFTVAEDYHQKYSLRSQRHLMREFSAMSPNESDFMNSTAAARVNGFLCGYGTQQAFASEVADYGLSPESQERLVKHFKRYF